MAEVIGVSTIAEAIGAISILLGRACSSTSLEAVSLCSQALRLLFERLDLVVELLGFGAVFRVIAAQFVEHLVDGEFVYLSHRNFP